MFLEYERPTLPLQMTDFTYKIGANGYITKENKYYDINNKKTLNVENIVGILREMNWLVDKNGVVYDTAGKIISSFQQGNPDMSWFGERAHLWRIDELASVNNYQSPTNHVLTRLGEARFYLYASSPKVFSWQNIVQFGVNNYRNFALLDKDGNFILHKYETDSYYTYIVNHLISIPNIKRFIGHFQMSEYTLIKNDNTIAIYNYNGDLLNNLPSVYAWTDIVWAQCSSSFTVGLKNNGTVVFYMPDGIPGSGDMSSFYLKFKAKVETFFKDFKHDVVEILYVPDFVLFLHKNGRIDGFKWFIGGTKWSYETYNFDNGFRSTKESLITSKTPINLLDKSKVKGFTINGVQPANTNRKVAFKVDDVWNKLTTDGALSPLPTQAITSNSVLAEGNTVAELTALTNVPSLVGKLVYPAIALYADENATVMPTFGMTVKAEIDTTVDVYTKTAYSQEFVLHNERDVLVKSISVDSNTKDNGKVTLKARYATFDETAITEEGAEQTEKWSDYVDLLSVINKKCHKLQIRADYQVSITDGSDSATLNDVIITYAKDVVAKADGSTDLVTLTEQFTNDLTYVHAYIKHKELIDADLKAYVRLQKTPQKADFKLIGYGTGARKTYKVTDSGINQDSLMVYVNGKAVYDFDFNTETSEITLVADVDVPINATYEFGWELFNYVEMQKVVSQINDSGAYTTEYSYTIPVHDGEYTVTAIKYELIRPEGKVADEVIGVGTGKRQIIQLPHFARKETIQCNGKWSYDYDSKRLTVIAPEGDNIVISYDWIAESPQVYGVMAGWAD